MTRFWTNQLQVINKFSGGTLVQRQSHPVAVPRIQGELNVRSSEFNWAEEEHLVWQPRVRYAARVSLALTG